MIPTDKVALPQFPRTSRTPDMPATNTTGVLSEGAITVATNLRSASLSIAAYDFVLTLPMEYRLYKSTKRDIVTLILFILIRILVLVSSNVGFFYHHFSPNFCRHYYRLTPIFKLVQLVISQAILGLRTHDISKKSRRVLWTILPAYFIVVGFQAFAAEYGRIREFKSLPRTLPLIYITQYSGDGECE
ncbi:hypothetical protein BGW80DRAFT_1454593 [Lactifluus volemus]|nr:hypothetical protein BGW80DRAFT_1454593 [Lactifluus volemus]